MAIIELKNIRKTYGPTNVLDNVSWQLDMGDKVALVGANGSGKTTLLRIISGDLAADSGFVRIGTDIQIGYVPQEADLDGSKTLREEVYDPELANIRQNLNILEEEMAQDRVDEQKVLKALDSYNGLKAEFINRDGYGYEARLGTILSRMGFYDLDSTVSSLSGGQKSKAQLAKILIRQPDLLLLDEPDSHLDICALEWLEDSLCNYKGTVLIVSHDRSLLEKVTDKTVEIENGRIRQYNGNYSYYADQKERMRVRQHYDYVNQQFEIAHLRDAIETLRKWSSKSSNPKHGRRVKSMENRLEHIEVLDKPRRKPKMQLRFEFQKRSGEIVIEAVSLSKSFGERTLFANANFQIRWGEHIGVIGPNGSGKTTLIRIILGLEQPTSGQVNLGSSLAISYFDQEQRGLNADKNIYEELEEGTNLTKNETMYLLSRILFTGNKALKKIDQLSGGEKNRVMLSKLVYTKANLLILDEPTNHLDIPSIEVLEEALIEFKGTVIAVSHDRHLLSNFASRIIELDNGKLRSHYGSYDDAFAQVQDN